MAWLVILAILVAGSPVLARGNEAPQAPAARPEAVENFAWIGAGLGLVAGPGIGWMLGAATVTALAPWLIGGVVVGGIAAYGLQLLTNRLNSAAYDRLVARARGAPGSAGGPSTGSPPALLGMTMGGVGR